jgi:hypothetical protein
MNACLMAKWAWKVYNGQGGLWLQILKRKYMQHKELAAIRSTRGSQLWKSILKSRQLIRIGARHRVGNGRNTLFWLDKWVLDEALSEKFPRLFAICDRPNALVAEIWRLPDARPNFIALLARRNSRNGKHLIFFLLLSIYLWF